MLKETWNFRVTIAITFVMPLSDRNTESSSDYQGIHFTIRDLIEKSFQYATSVRGPHISSLIELPKLPSEAGIGKASCQFSGGR